MLSSFLVKISKGVPSLRNLLSMYKILPLYHRPMFEWLQNNLIVAENLFRHLYSLWDALKCMKTMAGLLPLTKQQIILFRLDCFFFVTYDALKSDLLNLLMMMSCKNEWEIMTDFSNFLENTYNLTHWKVSPDVSLGQNKV